MSTTLVAARDNPTANLVVPYAFMDKYAAMISDLGCSITSRIDDPANGVIYYTFDESDWFEIDRMTMEKFEKAGIAYSSYSTDWIKNSPKLAKTDVVANHLRFNDNGEPEYVELVKDYERVDVQPLLDLAIQGRTHELEQAVLKAGAICTVPSFEDQADNGKLSLLDTLIGMNHDNDEDDADE